MSLRARALLAAGLWLLACSPAPGHGLPVVVTAAYPAYPCPVVPLYLAPAPLVCPAPALVLAPAAPGYAQPTAAPPSSGPAPQTAEPPRKDGPPKVTESRSFAGKESAAADGACCRVGFWNVSGHDVTLTVDGRPRLLPRNHNLTLRLGRQFTWRVDQAAPQSGRVPADRAGLEIVIRR